MSTRIVSVLLFEDVEVLDFAGPFEVFNVAGLLSGMRCFDVYTTAQYMEYDWRYAEVDGVSVIDARAD